MTQQKPAHGAETEAAGAAAEQPIDNPTVAEAGAADTPPAEAGAAARITELEAEVAKLRDDVLRAHAEAENTRRRTQREIENNTKYAVSDFAAAVLPVADNLRRALDALPAELRRENEKFESFASGVELTERELLSVLERNGIKPVDAKGKPFDHNFHQAVQQVDSPDHPAGTVVQVFQSGYTINGRLLRPAMVVVSKGPTTQQGAKVDTTA